MTPYEEYAEKMNHLEENLEEAGIRFFLDYSPDINTISFLFEDMEDESGRNIVRARVSLDKLNEGYTDKALDKEYYDKRYSMIWDYATTAQWLILRQRTRDAQ